MNKLGGKHEQTNSHSTHLRTCLFFPFAFLRGSAFAFGLEFFLLFGRQFRGALDFFGDPIFLKFIDRTEFFIE